MVENLNFNITDSQLVNMSRIQLNDVLHGVPINTRRQIKNRRRTLRNRQSASQSRMKLKDHLFDLEQTNTELKRKLEEVQKGTM